MAICDGWGTPDIGSPCMSVGGVQAVPWASEGLCGSGDTGWGRGSGRVLAQSRGHWGAAGSWDRQSCFGQRCPSGSEGLEMQAQPLCLCAALTQPSPFCSLAFNCRTILDRNCFLCFPLRHGVRLEDRFQTFRGWEGKLFTSWRLCFGVEGEAVCAFLLAETTLEIC